MTSKDKKEISVGLIYDTINALNQAKATLLELVRDKKAFACDRQALANVESVLERLSNL